jgi:glutathione S-transferase
MIKVHHLNFSRSTRILWALEELNVPYEIVRYERDANFRAPASLKNVHPLGKAPVIEDGRFKLAESAPILTYINERYGNGRLAPARGTDAAYLHDEWLQYAESSAALPLMFKIIGGMLGGLPDKVDAFATQGTARTLDYIAADLKISPFLMGDDLLLADIQLSYLLAIAEHVGLLQNHPTLSEYLTRLLARPACVRALAAGGPMTRPNS